MADFFADGELVEMTPEMKEANQYWTGLTTEQKEAILMMMKLLHSKNEKKPLNSK